MSRSHTARISVELTEWNTVTIPCEQLQPGDHPIAMRLSEKGQLIINELRNGLQVQARSWVGRVRLANIDIHVRPKLTGGDSYLIGLLMFCRGIGHINRTAGKHELGVDRSADLLDLLTLLLVEACERIMRDGPLTSYVARSADLLTVRGRIDARRQVLQHFGRADRVSCAFDELEYDIDENRLLAAALTACASRVGRSEITQRLRHASEYFQEICNHESLDLDRVRASLTYDRQNSRYQNGHAIAFAILEGLGLEDLFAASGPIETFAFMLDMNVLFEEFTCRLISKLFPGPFFRVESQRSDRSVLWNADANTSYKRVRPDIVLHAGNPVLTRLAIDSKYKLYDLRDLSSSDIYQGLLYAQAFSFSNERPIAVVIYPSEQERLATTRVHLRKPDGSTAVELLVASLPMKGTLDGLQREPVALPLELKEAIAAQLERSAAIAAR